MSWNPTAAMRGLYRGPAGGGSLLPMSTVQEQVAFLVEMFPRPPVSGAMVAGYLQSLQGVEPALLEQAIKELVYTSEWLPPVAAVRLKAAEIALDLPTEEEALADVERYAAESREAAVEGTERPAQLHPLVSRALTLMGGLAAYRASERPAWWRGEFKSTYRGLRAVAIYEVQVSDTIQRQAS